MASVSCALILLIVQVAVAQQPSSSVTDTQSPFLPVPAAVSDSLRFGAQLPEFEAKDITGRTWRREDLHGKLTLIYIWNTILARAMDAHDPHWRESIPGLPDLPQLQQFYDKVRNARNIQVLTFCSDYDYTHAQEYMKQRKYAFPVIADWVLINKLFPRAGGEPYWLVDSEGRLSYPFRSWSFGRVLFEVESAAFRK
jgi:peroxiredoxin